MLPVERPLLSKQLELLDDVLAQGIAPHKVSPPSSSFTSIRGRSRSERGVSLWIRSRGSLGGRGAELARRGGSGSRDGVPADASLLETPSTRRYTQISMVLGDRYLTGRRPRRTCSRTPCPTRRHRKRRRRSPRRSPSTGRATTSTCSSCRVLSCLRVSPREAAASMASCRDVAAMASGSTHAPSPRRHAPDSPVDVRAGTSTRA